MATIKNVNINGTVSKFSAGVYDVTEQNNGRHFADINEVLSNNASVIPENDRIPGMEIQFIQDFEAKYSVVRTDNLTEQPSGTSLNEVSSIQSGTYSESELNIVFQTLPSATGTANSVTYYASLTIDEVTSYISWVITKTENAYSEYVKYRLMSIGWSNVVYDWQGVDEEVLSDSENIVKSSALTDYLNDNYGRVVYNSDFVKVVTDLKGKILYGVKADGDFMFGVGVPTSIKQSISTKVDKVDGKGLSTNDFTNEEKEIVGCNYIIPSVSNWVDVKIDSQDKILEGINNKGEKRISEFDEYTKTKIKSIAGKSEGVSGLIQIPVINSDFVSPLPVSITGTKGDENAQYVFQLPVNNENFGVRFRFKITENLLNQEKNAIIASLNNVQISATVRPLTQYCPTFVHDGRKYDYWPCFDGGVSINGSVVAGKGGAYKRNIGCFAFSIQYTGNENIATIINDGDAISLKIGETVYTFAFSQYEYVSELYAALAAVNDIVLECKEIETRKCTELAVFGLTRLKSLYYTKIDGNHDDPKEEYTDAAPLFVPYAVDTKWHSAEILKIGEKMHAIVDGVLQTYSSFIDDNILTIGGFCGVLFKDFFVDLYNAFDAEEVFVNTANTGEEPVVVSYIISSWTPHLIIFEGHGMSDVPSYDFSGDNLTTTVDRLHLVYRMLKEKGYVAVSIKDISDYYLDNKMLPKRCFTTIFDDFRWDNFTNLNKRNVFTELGIKPNLAIVTDRNDTISENGQTLTKAEVAAIGRRIWFDMISHTHNHRSVITFKPSEYISQFREDIYSADFSSVVSDIIVYPYGESNMYSKDVMDWLGFKLGITVEGNSYYEELNTINKSRFYLHREEIGIRKPIENILNKIV